MTNSFYVVSCRSLGKEVCGIRDNKSSCFSLLRFSGNLEILLQIGICMECILAIRKTVESSMVALSTKKDVQEYKCAGEIRSYLDGVW